MSRRFFSLFIVAAVLTLVTIPSWAKNNSAGSLSATVELYSTTTINNTTLTPGQYRITAEGNQAKFEKNGKTVAEAPCTIKTLSNKAAQTQFIVDHDHLQEIQISGKTEAIEFSSSGSSGN